MKMRLVGWLLIGLLVGCTADPVAFKEPEVARCHTQTRFAVLARFAGHILTNDVEAYERAGWNCALMLTIPTWQEFSPGAWFLVSNDVYACSVEECRP